MQKNGRRRSRWQSCCSKARPQWAICSKAREGLSWRCLPLRHGPWCSSTRMGNPYIRLLLREFFDMLCRHRLLQTGYNLYGRKIKHCHTSFSQTINSLRQLRTLFGQSLNENCYWQRKFEELNFLSSESNLLSLGYVKLHVHTVFHVSKFVYDRIFKNNNMKMD